jgi:enoyl-CoA hydratase/carnithine racemase
MLTGRRMGASEAHDVGLVSQVVAAEQLLETARELARIIATKAPLAVRVARLTTRVAAEGSLEASLLAETLGSAALHGTADRDEGRRAFLEKRPARFEGR